jgi:hypothetical protein
MTVTLGKGRGVGGVGWLEMETRADVRHLAEELRALNQRMREFDYIDQRFNALWAKLDEIEPRLARLEGTTHHDGKDSADERSQTSNFCNR